MSVQLAIEATSSQTRTVKNALQIAPPASATRNAKAATRGFTSIQVCANHVGVAANFASHLRNVMFATTDSL